MASQCTFLGPRVIKDHVITTSKRANSRKRKDKKKRVKNSVRGRERNDPRGKYTFFPAVTKKEEEKEYKLGYFSFISI